MKNHQLVGKTLKRIIIIIIIIIIKEKDTLENGEIEY